MLKYPPDFRTAPFGCYSNSGFVPDCWNNPAQAVRNTWRNDVLLQQVYHRELLLSASVKKALDAVQRALDALAHKLADYFAPRYGLAIREALYQHLQAYNVALGKYPFERFQSISALRDIVGGLSAILASVHSNPAQIGPLLKSGFEQILSETLQQADSLLSGNYKISLEHFNNAVEESSKLADLIFNAFLA